MRKYLIITILLLFFPMLRAKAVCKNADIVALNNVAKNVTASYQYYEQGTRVLFKITLTNLEPSLVVHDGIKKKEYKDNKGEITSSDYEPGKMVRFLIYAKDSSCTDKILSTIYVNLPPYNPFYKDTLCEQVKDYKYCQKWVQMPFNYETFKKEIQAEIDARKVIEKEENIEIKNEPSLIDTMFQIYLKYYYIILPLIIIICAVSIFRLNKKINYFLNKVTKAFAI